MRVWVGVRMKLLPITVTFRPRWCPPNCKSQGWLVDGLPKIVAPGDGVVADLEFRAGHAGLVEDFGPRQGL